MEAFDTIIGQNVKLQGNLSNQGAIQVNGTVEGQIESDSTVIIGANALVKGPIHAKIVEVSGEIHGSVVAEDRLELNPKAKVFGDVSTKNFVVKLGASFEGKSTILKDNEANKNPAKTTPEIS